ncbi:hypothetical protein [Planobispora longispora]|uniref:Uncharacterized protein n=1 Tax=Planobispora longispora TaxID=28887 RepID=A0A8J3RGU4_9ACTN|nr:hypothetical protein [Planobispora longispora]GIH75442.1 hypothetical protein Plo01_18710 [Planobispora longispora]
MGRDAKRFAAIFISAIAFCFAATGISLAADEPSVTSQSEPTSTPTPTPTTSNGTPWNGS